jgi:hypothetical protein
MPRLQIPKVVTEGVREHRAVRAWRQFHSEAWEPRTLETLQRKNCSVVYRLDGVGRGGQKVIAKRCRATTARLERLIYQELLPLSGMPTVRCYGLLPEPDGELWWLFLEDADGAAYLPQIPEHRALAGRWLAETQLAIASADLTASLPTRDLDHYLRLLHACRAMVRGHLDDPTLPAAEAAVLGKLAVHFDLLESQWAAMEQICRLMPRTLVHDDFVIKNLQIRDTAGGPALMVFDWEFAGWGVPAVDLAQSIDRVASPDLGAYQSILRREYSQLNLRDVHAIAVCGNLLRILDQISWATTGLEIAPIPQLVKAISKLEVYEPAMIDALGALLRSWS